jgi:hypothetical protein
MTVHMIEIRKAILNDSPVITEFQQKMAWETEQFALVPEIVTDGVNAVFEIPLGC